MRSFNFIKYLLISWEAQEIYAKAVRINERVTPADF